MVFIFIYKGFRGYICKCTVLYYLVYSSTSFPEFYEGLKGSLSGLKNKGGTRKRIKVFELEFAKVLLHI